MKTKRTSNFELLRIVALLIIIASHIHGHCINIQLQGNYYSDIFGHPLFYSELGILAIIAPMGVIGNAIFILISGYFMASKPAENINLIASAKKLLTQLFYAIILLTAGSLAIVAYDTLQGGQNSSLIVDLQELKVIAWFPGYYFLILLIARLFLNKYLQSLDKNKYITLLVSLFSLTQFMWTVKVIQGLGYGFDTLITGLLLYSLGGYIRQYNPFDKIRSWVLVIVILGSNLAFYISFYLMTIKSIGVNNVQEDNFVQTIPDYTNYSLPVLMIGLCLFELFRRLPSFYNKTINWVGSATFMIYLLHDTALFQGIWKKQAWLPLLQESVLKCIITLIIYVVATFIVGVVAYLIYALLFKIIESEKFQKVINK